MAGAKYLFYDENSVYWFNDLILLSCRIYYNNMNF